jgi:hypothetical protein
MSRLRVRRFTVAKADDDCPLPGLRSAVVGRVQHATDDAIAERRGKLAYFDEFL